MIPKQISADALEPGSRDSQPAHRPILLALGEADWGGDELRARVGLEKRGAVLLVGTEADGGNAAAGWRGVRDTQKAATGSELSITPFGDE
jgi:hypothetical protein